MSKHWNNREVGQVADWLRMALAGRTDARQSAKRMRDRAIALLISRNGLSTGQITAMKMGDVDLGTGLATVLSSRARRREIVEMDADVSEAMRRWMAMRPMMAKRGVTELFVSLHTTKAYRAPGSRMTDRGVRAMMAAYCVEYAEALSLHGSRAE